MGRRLERGGGSHTGCPLGWGGAIPLASGGVSRRGLPALVPGDGLRYPFLALFASLVRSLLARACGRGWSAAPGWGGVRGGPWTAPLGVPADLLTPPLSPLTGLWLREGHAGRGLLRIPLCTLLRHAGVGSREQVQPPLPLPCRRPSCGWGRPPGPGGAEGRACGSPAGVSAGGGGGGGGGRPPARSRVCVEGGGGGEWGGPSVPWRCLLSAKKGGGAAWRSRPRGPAIGQGGRALPPPPSTESRILSRSLSGAPHPPAVVARRWPAGGGREGQRSVVSGLRGSRFPPALAVSALPPAGGGAPLSLGRQQSGRHWCRAVHGGRGHPYHSGSRPPGFSGHNLRGVPVRRRGPTRSARPPFEPAAGAWGRVTLRLPSRAGGVHPFCLGGWGPGPPWLAGRWGGGGGGPSRRGLPALVPGGGLWYSFLALSVSPARSLPARACGRG